MAKLLISALLFQLLIFAGESTEKPDHFGVAMDHLYREIGLDGNLDKSVFGLSMVGYLNMKMGKLLHDDSIITIIDYKKASKDKRFFVINLVERKILFATYVAHGKGSGVQFAESFSNTPGSLKSSIGFFITDESYVGRHGYSLKLQGVEPGINDNAMQRSIVIHGANYVSEAFVQEYGRLGRSWGCPAIPEDITRQVIDRIKGGSCLFVYYDDAAYLNESSFLDRESAQKYFMEIQSAESGNDTLLIKGVSVETAQP